LIVAVTGNTGSGKSTVAGLFALWGGRRIDADRIGKEVWQDDRELQEEIIGALGREIIGPRGSIDAKLLGHAVFGDAEKLRRFDQIVQPRLRARISRELEEAEQKPGVITVLDAALLFEWGLEERVDHVVVVVAREEERLRRVSERQGLSPAEALHRVRSQTSEEEKAKRADTVIENDGSLAELEERAARVWEAIVGSAPKGNGPRGEER
jgi:dephospho-CoA kinase